MAADDDIDRLYQLPLGEFIGARNALAAERKQAGDKDGAAAVKALGKPSVGAWAVNQLWWTARGRMDALRDAGDDVRAAQHGGDAAELQGAMKARRALERELVDRAAGLLGDATESTLRKVQVTIETLATYGTARGFDGRLVRELDPPGFEVLAELAASPPPPRARPSRTEQPAAATRRELALVVERRAARERAKRAADKAAAERDLLSARAAAARDELAEARRRVERAAERVAEADAELARAGAAAERAAADLAELATDD